MRGRQKAYTENNLYKLYWAILYAEWYTQMLFAATIFSSLAVNTKANKNNY